MGLKWLKARGEKNKKHKTHGCGWGLTLLKRQVKGFSRISIKCKICGFEEFSITDLAFQRVPAAVPPFRIACSQDHA